MAPFRREDAPILLLFVALLLVIVEGLDAESIGDERSELFGEILRDEVVERINQLAEISDADGYLERTFLSPASLRAAELIIKWMQDAGLKTWVDQMGNVHGRIESVNKTERTLLIGSHFDTVVDAGKFDGSSGIIAAISALKALKISGKLLKLERPIEVKVTGSQGHAGTVPMLMRQDPMTAAAELIVNLESLCKYPDKAFTHSEQCGYYNIESFSGLVCTVGEISTWPSASNVIPSQVNFTTDVRAMDDVTRETAISEFSRQIYRICDNRMVNCTINRKHNADAVQCDSELRLQLKQL